MQRESQHVLHRGRQHKTVDGVNWSIRQLWDMRQRSIAVSRIFHNTVLAAAPLGVNEHRLCRSLGLRPTNQ